MSVARSISDLWFYLRHPEMWGFRLGPVNATWDEWLTKAAEEGAEVKRLDSYTVEIRGVAVWVSNWPYAFGNPHLNGDKSERIYPSRRTALRLKQAIDALDRPKPETAAQVIEMATKRANT